MLFLQGIIATLLGVGAGIITGLAPGIHINLVSLILVSVSGYLLGFIEPLTIGIFIVAMGVTHTFLDAIPSIFLGAPEAETALNVLPGHVLLMKGRGYEAVKLTVIGSLVALLMTVAIIPFTIPFIGPFFDVLQPYMGIILILIVVFMLLKEHGTDKKLWSLFIFLMAGILGLITLNVPNLKQPLFPLLSGFFGVSTFMTSLNDKVVIPEQKISDELHPSKVGFLKSTVGATVFGSLTSIFPGLSAAEAAIIALQFLGDLGIYSFLILIGGINTVAFVYSLGTFYAIGKARNGAVVAILQIVKSIDKNGLIILLATALIAGACATYLSLYFSKVFSAYISKINYQKLCISIIMLIVILTIFFTGFVGILILITSTAIGLLAPMVGVKRSNAMGCLLLPVILFFTV